MTTEEGQELERQELERKEAERGASAPPVLALTPADMLAARRTGGHYIEGARDV